MHQPSAARAPGNAIRGDFFVKGEAGWRRYAPSGRDFIMRHYRAYGGAEPPPTGFREGFDDVVFP